MAEKIACVTQLIHGLKQQIATFGDGLTYQDIVKRIFESHNKEGKFDIDMFSHDMFILHIIVSDEEQASTRIEMGSRSDIEVINEDVEIINEDITLDDAIILIKARIPDENCSNPVDTLSRFMSGQFVVDIDFIDEELKNSEMCTVHMCIANEILVTGSGSNYDEACVDAARRTLRCLNQDDNLLTSLVKNYYLLENESSEHDRREYQEWLDQRYENNDEY